MRLFLTIAALALMNGSAFAADAASASAPQPLAPTTVSAVEDKVLNVESFTLINGMKVFVIPNHRVPVVTQMVWYKVGSADEAPGESGLAHFVEHLMFKGSENVPPGEFSRRVKGMGGEDNAFTGQDYTAYFQTVTTDHLPQVMDMEADRMRGLLFPPDHVKSERQVVLEERRERTENDPRGYFAEQMRAMLFINHPYGDPIGGWFNEVDALKRDTVSAFYKKWYAPNNAILVVSGDITAKELEPLANRTYGTVPARDVPDRHWTKVPPMIALPRLVLHHPSIEQPVYQRMIRVPSLHESREDSMALQVLEEIMDGGAATRLYKSLVVDRKLATGVGLDYDPLAWDDATLVISGTPADGVDMKQLEEGIDAELRLLVRKGISATELAEAKSRMKDAAIFARDSISGPAMLVGRTLATGGTLDDVEYWPSMIDQVTADQVARAAHRFLDPDNFRLRPYLAGEILPGETVAETDAANDNKLAAQSATETAEPANVVPERDDAPAPKPATDDDADAPADPPAPDVAPVESEPLEEPAE